MLPFFAHAYISVTGKARIEPWLQSCARREADDACAFITAAAARLRPCVIFGACARFGAIAAARSVRSFISLLAVVALPFPSWKNDIILTGIVAVGAAQRLQPTWRICV